MFHRIGVSESLTNKVALNLLIFNRYSPSNLIVWSTKRYKCLGNL